MKTKIVPASCLTSKTLRARDYIGEEASVYEFRGFIIRNDMMESIRNYVDHGLVPGRFLGAVICNNLKDAVAYADEWNIRNIPAYVDYFYNHTPSPCWGSEESMLEWIKYKDSERTQLETLKANVNPDG